jgi:hypothetical protein
MEFIIIINYLPNSYLSNQVTIILKIVITINIIVHYLKDNQEVIIRCQIKSHLYFIQIKSYCLVEY